MRLFLFKFFIRIASYFSLDGKWLSKQIHIEKQLKICRERQKEMDACVRPRSYPKVRGEAHYTDYFDEDNWKAQ